MSSANQLAEPLAFAGSRDKLIISRRLASSQDLPSLLRLPAELASSRIYTFTYTPLPPFSFPFSLAAFFAVRDRERGIASCRANASRELR